VSIIEKAAGRIAVQGGKTASPSRHAVPEAEPILQAAQPARQEPAAVPDNGAQKLRQLPGATPPRNAQRHAIDLERLRGKGMVTPSTARTRVAEEFRFIKRPLLSNALRKGEGAIRRGNLIMVTSSLPGEGKTFCAINLAMSIAMEMDHTVLLIDADVARPSLLTTLGLEAEHGLMDLLCEPAMDMADVMLKTNIETLSILSAGKSTLNATELLASQSMKILLDEIASRYADRIVIFDSPPLLLTSEARVLAEQMGQIVMVVEGEKTTQGAVKDALHKIESCPNVSLIYNKARALAETESYGYYRA